MIGRVCGALLLLVACARSRAALETDAASIREGGDSVFVEVVNDNYYDARIHVVYDGGGRFTLGTVPGNQRQKVAEKLLRLSWAFVHLPVGGDQFLAPH